ncbi:MAG: AAA family ATPase [Saprospiraceae bacterium]
MIIKKVIIENFLCYYDKKEFVFADGLNIILGENGEGKTKFYEALVWLFNGNVRNLKNLISAKKLNELEEGNSFEVSVKIQVEQHEVLKQVSRSFNVEKRDEEINTYNSSIKGVSENSKGERETVDGKNLLKEIFPSEFRKYSMFKGESELNIFNETKSLKNLIDTFSFAKHYDKYTKSTSLFEERINKDIDKESRRSKKQEKDYRKLQGELDAAQRELRDLKNNLEFANAEKEKSEKGLNEIENNLKNAEEIKTINTKIKEFEEKIRRTELRIDENYTKALLDEKWILVHFEPIFKEYNTKINSLSRKRRKLENEHEREIGKKQQRQETAAEFVKEFVPLPIETPSKELMQEMLDEEVCKVCGREAPKDSEAYSYMMEKLEKLLKSLSKDDEKEEEPLYKHDYLKRLRGIQQNQESNLYFTKEIKDLIVERYEFNEGRKKEMKRFKEKLEVNEADKIKILSEANQSEINLLHTLNNFRAFGKTSKEADKNITRFTHEIEKLERIINTKKVELDKIDRESSNNYLIETRQVIRDIATIFRDTEKRKFNEFLDILEKKANRIFSKINIDAFTGIIKFRLNDNKDVRIELQELNGKVFARPNQSLLTSKYLSILFAISELTKENNDESFPMIFDAPTSSFGETKKAQFFNLLSNTPGQKILLIKDFLVKDANNSLVIKEEFKEIKRDKAIWVKLERPFDDKKLHTINSQVIHL